MIYRLHYNKSNGIFSVRCTSRETIAASERHALIPVIGDIVPLPDEGHARYLLITQPEFIRATYKQRVVLSAIKTHFPHIRLLFKRLKEAFISCLR